jgi:N6-L-threonylcarbamoyladenine synthase
MVRRDQTPADADFYDVSFSGLKTAVLNAVKAADAGAGRDAERAAIARAFQDSLIDTLVEKTVRAVREFGRERVVLGGGVACNRSLVAAMRARFADRGVQVYAPVPRFATDNAAMIARAGLFHLERGERSALDLNAFASQPLPGLVAA